MAGTVLTLSSTKFDRPTVLINDEPYEMRAGEELSVAFIRRMESLGKQLKADEIEIEEKGELLKDSVRTVMVNVPDEVLEVLTFRQHAMIVETFSEVVRSKSSNDGDPTTDPIHS